MRSIERRFDNIQRLNPCWSSWVCFTEAIKGQGFNKKMVSRHFNALVEKDDYDKRDKKELIKNLTSLTLSLEKNS